MLIVRVSWIDKLAKQQGTHHDASSHVAGPSSDAGISPQSKCKRCSLCSETVPNNKHVCFFCDLPAGTEKLHEATTLELDDDRLMAKLAKSDMIAVKAKYHLNVYIHRSTESLLMTAVKPVLLT